MVGQPDRVVVAPKAEAAVGYAGRPALKPPVWTWEVPLYFFVGGITGASGVLALAARLAGDAAVRDALVVAVVGAALSAGLLTLDLGRPARFLHMLRVFKWRSPMSLGVWILTSYGAVATLALATVALGAPGAAVVPLLAMAAALGSLVATYTGVLIGATAVPIWRDHRGMLPAHFGTAALGSAAAVLSLLGHGGPTGTLLAIAAAVETVLGAVLFGSSRRWKGRALRAGRVLFAAALLSGPVALVLWALGWHGAAAVAFLAGACVSRFGWLQAGRASAMDPRAVLGTG